VGNLCLTDVVLVQFLCKHIFTVASFVRCTAVLESHYSVITSLAFSHSGKSMIR